MAPRLAGMVRAVCLAGLLLAAGQSSQAASTRAQGGLKLSVIAPEPASIGDRLNLDVSFRGATVEAVEVYLDGALVAKRQLAGSQTHGVMTFVLETMLLSEGDHDLLIKAFGPDGGAVTAPARIRMPGPDLSAPVRIAYPLNGVQVSGIVPIRVKVDSELQRQRPYVTFFINKELKVLRNYPPYEYNWDTTTHSNGWHALEAWTQSPDMAAPYKSRPVHVSVNNAGGMTQRQDTVEDLRAGTRSDASKPAPSRTPEPKRAIVLAPEPSASQVGPAAPAATERRTVAVGEIRTAEPSTRSAAKRSAPAVPPPAVAPIADRMPRVATRMVGASPVEPGGRRAAAKPAPVVAVKPGETLADVSRKTGVATREIARLNNVPPSPKAALPAGRSLIVPQVGSFDVAFDGVVIAFDVVPRVEAGIGLAPIRQIFEHTGGRLYWFGGKAQTVRAVNETREIELRIGKGTALVNNRTLSLDRAPFIDSGRTMVPLTFIRDALAVNVNYDNNSGKVMLRSK